MSSDAHRLHVGDVYLEARMRRNVRGTLGIVIVHPYPLLGGFYNDPVVSAIYRQALAAPDVNTVIKYNQRGVGKSEGSKSIWGYRDCQDLTVICKYLLALQNGPQALYVIGYSFGACIAAHALAIPEVAGYVGISPPLGGMAGIALRSGGHLSLLQAAPVPKLILFGDMDQFASAASAQAFTERHNAKCVPLHLPEGCSTPPSLPGGRALSSRLELQVFPDCDHFWMEEKAGIAKLVVSWIVDTARLWARLEAS
eukprot:jgi/Botrbrau1/9875/Bobra.0080s0010.1